MPSSMVMMWRRSGRSGSSACHPWSELTLVDQRHQVGVGEQVPELVVDVAVVDVDPHRPQLEHGPRRLHPLHAVEGVDAHVVAGTYSVGCQVVGQAVGPLLHLGIGAPLAVGDQVLPVAVGVDSVLEQVSEVERHRSIVEHVSIVRQAPRGPAAPSAGPLTAAGSNLWVQRPITDRRHPT